MDPIKVRFLRLTGQAKDKWLEIDYCLECDEQFGPSQHYMVKDKVWKQVATSGFLHLACLEKLLGRPLTIKDFRDLPVNDSIFFGYRLGKS